MIRACVTSQRDPIHPRELFLAPTGALYINDALSAMSAPLSYFFSTSGGKPVLLSDGREGDVQGLCPLDP